MELLNAYNRRMPFCLLHQLSLSDSAGSALYSIRRRTTQHAFPRQKDLCRPVTPVYSCPSSHVETTLALSVRRTTKVKETKNASDKKGEDFFSFVNLNK